MTSNRAVNNEFQITSQGSSSRIPNGQKQVQKDVSLNQVIFIANFKRHLINILILKEFGIFHQALLVVTSNRDDQLINSDKQYHIVEYQDDSKVKGYQINLKNKHNAHFLKDLNKFEDEEFIWEKISLKKQFDIDTLDLTVFQIMDRMQNIAYLRGSYNLLTNNCQDVANQLTEQLLLENISNKNVVFLALTEKQSYYEEGESQSHSALLVVTNYSNNGSQPEDQKYYIIEYLKDGKIKAYQFYIKNQPQNLENLNQFNNGRNFWQTKAKICKFYIQQTVSNIIDQMNNINYDNVKNENNSYRIAKYTFDQMNQIQEQERQRQSSEFDCKEGLQKFWEILKIVIMVFAICQTYNFFIMTKTFLLS
ncbi:unnamed protein product (macronuclear) [Paramecium tetraurelia]|uniref:Transmembrane protein n=1 Tax=Paramecium tetraurelia TaxID=5888 RepID=A0EAF0_PARTE|nr:uncharacterized protein GSPATT00024999001 [Paramecium tetraurelia]CAK92267.1 unnamed protein product [Paramecium tetraurelia]|eukprot:XP_001459664.1 hypothetical protein (macronuclear) [Paramecium tetraurelia strain d4-2]